MIRLLPRTATALLLLLLAACAPSVGPAPQIDVDFPSPLSGPGRPALSPVDQETVELAWRLLLAGDSAAAIARANLAGEQTPARLLILQAALVEGDAAAAEKLSELTREHPGYAAAWLTLSVAAEAEKDEGTALMAAGRGAELWPSRVWQRRARDLHEEWIDRRIEEGTSLLEAGDPETALVELEAAIALEPSNQAALLPAARALVALGRLDEAAAVLQGMNEDDAVFLYGNVAELQGDWQLALDLYALLPANHPGREEALQRTRMRWRLSNLPSYAQEAIASDALDRGEMAVLLVSLVPRIESLGEGGVPLLTDVVELPSYRELVAAVRTGLVSADLIDHKLHPRRPVDAAQVQAAVNRLCELLSVPAPSWCADLDEGELSCVSPDSLLTGQALAALVLEVVHGESQ